MFIDGNGVFVQMLIDNGIKAIDASEIANVNKKEKISRVISK